MAPTAHRISTIRHTGGSAGRIAATPVASRFRLAAVALMVAAVGLAVDLDPASLALWAPAAAEASVDLVGISNHERDPYLTPTNWSSRTSPWPNATSFTREGWDHLFDFCANHGKQACFPEWGPIERHPAYEPSRYPEELFRLTRFYIEARLGLFAYDCYFNGDEAKLTANPDWAGTREYKRLWGR